MGSPLPRGVFGFVKRVQHKGNQMSCAAKFIPLRSRTRTQAYRERDVLAELSHPLVTRLLDQFETRKTLILVLELYPAPSPESTRREQASGEQGSPALRTCDSGVLGPAFLVGAASWASHVPVTMLCG